MLWYPLSILLLAAIGAKLIGPHGGLQVDKEAVTEVTRSVDWPSCLLLLQQTMKLYNKLFIKNIWLLYLIITIFYYNL